jgi:hypothetical protein
MHTTGYILLECLVHRLRYDDVNIGGGIILMNSNFLSEKNQGVRQNIHTVIDSTVVSSEPTLS